MIATDDRELCLCVELRAEQPAWVEDLPPAPVDGRVTASFGTTPLTARDRAAVAELGYEPVGTAVVGHADEVVHLMVPLALVERHPRWWRAVLDAATRVFDLRFGPVQLALRTVIETHRRPTAGPTPVRVPPHPTS
jgi:hypothetical protein